MPRFSVSGFGFTVDFPIDWECSVSGGNVSFFKAEGGKGALTMSSMRPPAGVVPDGSQLLRRFRGDPVEVPSPQDGAKRHYLEVDKFELAWRYWALTTQSRAVIVSYNCKKEDRDQERSVVDSIVESARVL